MEKGDRMTATLDLWPIGNCQVSALVDRAGRFVWGCVPRVDGDPAFSSLLDDAPRAGVGARGFWEIDLEDCVATTQSYLRNTPILVTRHTDAVGIDARARLHIHKTQGERIVGGRRCAARWRSLDIRRRSRTNWSRCQ